MTMGLGAGGAARGASVVVVGGWAVGGARGAGRLGIKDPFIGGAVCGALGEVTLRGIGGGARGFSKLSSPLRGNRGLCGGLSRGWTEP